MLHRQLILRRLIFGIALGAYLGGIVTNSLGLIHTAWVGGIMVVGAVILTAWSMTLEKEIK